MKIESQELSKELFDYHEDGYLLWKSNTNKPIIGKKVYCYINGGYLIMEHRNVKNSVHRIIFLWHNGYLPKSVDHDDRDKLNNRIGNLRDGDNDKNCYNCGPRGTTSDYKGVSLVHTTKKYKIKRWGLSFKCKKENVHISKSFKSEIEAALAYNKLAVKYHGEFAVLNIIHPTDPQ